MADSKTTGTTTTGTSTKAGADPAPLVKLQRPDPIGVTVVGKTEDYNGVILPDLRESKGVIVVTADAILAAAATIARCFFDDQMTDDEKLAAFNKVYNWLGYESRPTLEDCTAKETLRQVLQDVLAKNAFALHPLNAPVV